MVVGEGLILEEQEHKEGKNGEREEFLDHLKLPEIEWAAVADKSYTVCRHHEAVLDQRNAPTEKDDHWQRQLAEPGRALQLQMTVPRECHEHIRTYQQQKCIYTFHIKNIIP